MITAKEISRDYKQKVTCRSKSILRWKKRLTIMLDGTSSHCKLYWKGRKAIKHIHLYERLENFACFLSKSRKLENEIDPTVGIKNLFIVRFSQRYQIRMRVKQRKKKQHTKEKIPELMKWHPKSIKKYMQKIQKTQCMIKSGEIISQFKGWTLIIFCCHLLYIGKTLMCMCYQEKGPRKIPRSYNLL